MTVVADRGDPRECRAHLDVMPSPGRHVWVPGWEKTYSLFNCVPGSTRWETATLSGWQTLLSVSTGR